MNNYPLIFLIFIFSNFQLNSQAETTVTHPNTTYLDYQLTKENHYTAKIESDLHDIQPGEFVEILHSTDNQDFSLLGLVSYQKIEELGKLEFLHPHPENGINYYQFHLKDTSGKTRIASTSKSLEFDLPPLMLDLNWDAGTDRINILYSLQQSQTAKISLADAKGNLLKEFFVQGIKGNNLVYLLSRDLKEGTYILNVEIDKSKVYRKVHIARKAKQGV